MQLSVTVNLDDVFSSFPTGPPVRDEAFHNRWWSSLHSNGKLRQSSFCMFPLSTWALGVCVAPEFLWWNRNPQGKVLWRWACGESWGQRAELSWILCCLKWEKLLFSCPLRSECCGVSGGSFISWDRSHTAQTSLKLVMELTMTLNLGFSCLYLLRAGM